MIRRNMLGDVLWIDLVSPSQKEINDLFKEYKLNSEASHDLARQSLRPKYAKFDDTTLIVLHFPAFLNRKGFPIGHIKEIDFVISKNIIITTRYENFAPIDTLIRELTTGLPLSKYKPKGARDVFAVMMRRLYEHLFDETEGIEHKLRIAEEGIFRGEEKRMVENLSIISREIIDFQNALNHHLEIIEQFRLEKENSSTQKKGKATRSTAGSADLERKIKEIINLHGKIETSVSRSDEFLDELRETNDSLLSAKQNEVMKRFTILAFIFLPLNFISALFGMNAKNMPIIGNTHDFYILLLLTAFVGCCTYIYFKFRKWL